MKKPKSKKAVKAKKKTPPRPVKVAKQALATSSRRAGKTAKQARAKAVAQLEASASPKLPKAAPPVAVPVGTYPITLDGLVPKQERPERKAAKPLVIQRGDYAVFRNRHANYALRLQRDDRMTSYTIMSGGGLTLNAVSHDRFAHEYSEQCAYPIERAAQLFARFGIDAGCALSVVEHLEKILNGGSKELTQKLRERSAAASAQSQSEHTDGGTMATKAKSKSKVPSAATAKRTTGGFTPESKLTWLIKENPRSKGGATFARFAKYFGSKTVGEYLQKGGTSGDLRWDVAHKYLTVSK